MPPKLEIEETLQQRLARFAVIAKTLTQDQIDACAWVMGGSGCNWNPNNVSATLENEASGKGRFAEI